MECTVQLTLDEINHILGLLGKREFDEVASLIIKIRGQVIPQVQAQAQAQAQQEAAAQEQSEG